MAAGKLTPKQERFIQEYLIDLNAAAAARRAGYSVKTADRTGHENLRKPEISAAVAAAQQARAKRVGVTADRTLDEIACCAFSDIGEILDFSGDVLRLRLPKDIPERARRAIASVKVRRVVEGSGEASREVELTEFKLWDKTANERLLLEHMGELKEQSTVDVRHSGAVAGLGADALRDMPPEDLARLYREALGPLARLP